LCSIVGFLANVLFTTARASNQPPEPKHTVAPDQADNYDGVRLTIGFSAATAIFSIIAYFLIDPLKETMTIYREHIVRQQLHGRRSLMLSSLAGSTVMLFIFTFLVTIDESSQVKLPITIISIVAYAFFYAPGAGSVPFLYSSEIWPNEGRGMSLPILPTPLLVVY
jgi:MFS family permease